MPCYRNILKVKVKLSLCLTKYTLWKCILCLSTMPWRCTQRGGTVPSVLNLGTKWRWMVSFTLGERQSINLIGGCMCPRASLDAVAKGKIPTPARNQSSAIQPIYQIYWQIVVKGSSVRWWQQLEHIRKKSARTRDIVGNTLAWNYTSQKVFIMFLKFSCRIWCSCTTFRILLLVHIYDIQHFITAIYFYWFSTVQ